MRFIDFNNCSRNNRFYGGNAGNKYGIRFEDGNWILKFPASTRDLKNPQISYTTSPLSEYLGSKIYELFNIPVHETLLGHVKTPVSGTERLVVACKDFCEGATVIRDFKEIKNAQFFGDGDAGTSGNGTVLSEVLETIEHTLAFEDCRDLARNRFWDQFIIDFVIGNGDRNNTNWGVLRDLNSDSILGLTPVFDNGNAFVNKRGLEVFERRLWSEEDILTDAYKVLVCAYTTDDNHRIHPYELIASSQYSDCNDALKRFVKSYDYSKVQALFDDIPAYVNKIAILPQAQKDFYLAMINARVNNVLIPTFEKLE